MQYSYGTHKDNYRFSKMLIHSIYYWDTGFLVLFLLIRFNQSKIVVVKSNYKSPKEQSCPLSPVSQTSSLGAATLNF